MNVLKTENLKKYYGSGDSLVRALDGGRPGGAAERNGVAI